MTEDILIDVKIEGNDADFAKLERLKNALVSNKNETAALNKAYKDGLITQKSFADQSVRLEASNKKLSASYVETQKRITGLKSPLDQQKVSFDQLIAGVDRLVPGVDVATKGMGKFVQSAKAFIATPIGIVIAALAAVIGVVTAALKTNDEAADDFEAIWGAITAVFDEVLRSIGLVGSALINFAKGNFSQGVDQLGEAAEGLSIGLVNAAKAGYELTRAFQALEDDENKFSLTLQSRKNQIDQLIIQSKNRTTSEKERIALNKQASDLERKLTEEEIANIQRRSDLELNTIGQKNGIQRKLNETTAAYGLRLIENSKIGGDTAKEIVKSVNAVDVAMNSSIKLQEKLQNQRQALEDKAAADRQKRREEEEKRLQKEADDRGKNFQIQIELDKQGFEDAKKKRQDDQKLKVDEDAAESARIAAVQDQRLNTWLTKKAEANEKEKKQTEEMESFNKAVLMRFDSILQQQLASGQEASKAILKTFLLTALAQLKLYFQAIILAQELSSKGIFGLIFAAAEIAIVEVAFAVASSAINGFADGGKVMGGMPIKRSNGDNRLITAYDGEAVITPEQQMRLGGAPAMRAAGVPGFATGGVVGSSLISSQDNRLMREMIKAFREQRLVMPVEQVTLLQNQQAQIKETATL